MALLSTLAASAQAPATLTVQVNKPGAAVNKNMYGSFFEDINFAADGGLYPELVKNKSFEINPGLIGWKAIGGGFNLDTYAVRDEQPVSSRSPHYLRIATRNGASGEAGLENEGFRGMGVKQGAEYTLSLYARRGRGPSRASRRCWWAKKVKIWARPPLRVSPTSGSCTSASAS